MEPLVLSIVANALLFCLLLVSFRFNIKFGRHILEVQDGIEESLDILDKRYGSMSEILEKPIFFDSTEIRQAINDISTSRDAILYVANILGDIEEEVESKNSESI